MAFQEGLIKLTGRIGDLSFYKTDGAYMARTCGGASAFRIKHDAAFVRTRELNAEFCRAGKATKIIRTALRSQIAQIADRYMTGRLVKEMVRVIGTDQINKRGERNLTDGNLQSLEGFEFNDKRQLHDVILVPPVTSINRASGSVIVNIEAFSPKNEIAFPDGATHFKFVSAVSEIDFKAESSIVTTTESNVIALNIDQASIVLPHRISAGSEHPIFVTLGIIFFQQVNNTFYPLKDKKNHALAFVKIDHQKPKTPTMEYRPSNSKARHRNRSKTNNRFKSQDRFLKPETPKTETSNLDDG